MQALPLKLSKRLRKIEQMVTSDYSHIWDCCCDHGFLGAALLSRQAAKNIHFVDIVPELMSELESKLQRFYSNSESHWYTHCLDVAALPLLQHEGKQLIIIAGVGGDLMIQFIEAIHQRHPKLCVDFLLCPVHHQFALRQKLNELNFSLQDEVLVEDNQRFYEAILVSSAPDENAPITLVGDKIWQSNSDKQTDINKKYLTKTLDHYQRIQQGNTSDVSHIIDAYRAITL
ncbi:SAM-dependent methyltransferase [Photobacterium sanguinicancri]|uniref:SAM-dependent methyltransferase n=1 Tax=Photobacterium sanguinicancri TaxID=875932 RepID=A0ABX4FVY3_9GAMM|nr:SAM-dependent methyltransferase [Photobacterium sanguinicancri]